MRNKLEYKGLVITNEEVLGWITEDIEEDILDLDEEDLKELKQTTKLDDCIDIIMKYSFKEMDELFGSDSTIAFHLWMAKTSFQSWMANEASDKFQQIARKNHTDIRLIPENLYENYRLFRVEVGVEPDEEIWYLNIPIGKSDEDKKIDKVWFKDYNDMEQYFIEYTKTYRENMLKKKEERKKMKFS